MNKEISVVEDKHHIKMEDVSSFLIERSADYSFWEEISHQELNETILSKLSEGQLKVFFSVVRNGSACKLGDDYYYRIKAG